MSRLELVALVFGLAAIVAGLFRLLVGVTHGDGLLALVWVFGLAAVWALWRDALANTHRGDR